MNRPPDSPRPLRPGDVVDGFICVGGGLGVELRPLADVIKEIQAGVIPVPLSANVHPDIRKALLDSRKCVWSVDSSENGIKRGFRPTRTGNRGR